MATVGIPASTSIPPIFFVECLGNGGVIIFVGWLLYKISYANVDAFFYKISDLVD
jgi:hypothetical protein